MKVFTLTSPIVVFLGLIAPRTTAQEGLKHLYAVPLNGSRPVSLAAVSIERGAKYPAVINLKGSVEIQAPVCLPVGEKRASVCDGDLIVRADEAYYHEDTGEIQAHGNVHITPLRHRVTAPSQTKGQ